MGFGACGGWVLPVGGEVAVHFVDGEDFFDVDDLVDDLVDFVVGLYVAWVVVLDELDIGAEVAGFAYAGACFDAVGFGLVAGCDAAGGVDSEGGDDADGAASEGGLVLLFDGGEEAVEIDE